MHAQRLSSVQKRRGIRVGMQKRRGIRVGVPNRPAIRGNVHKRCPDCAGVP